MKTKNQMEKIFTSITGLTLSALLVFALVTSSCKKSSTTTTTTTPTPTVAPTPSMSASYTAGVSSTGGIIEPFTTSLQCTNQFGTTYGISGTAVYGSGSNSQSYTIYMVASITGTGTVSLGGSNDAQFIVNPTSTNTTTTTYDVGYPTSNPGTGVLNVTTFNKSAHLISGTFSFTAGTPTTSGPTTIVNNGSFSNVTLP
jgi:hypothetical protein